jgi:GNAT superfamily N-acetyltransferase
MSNRIDMIPIEGKKLYNKLTKTQLGKYFPYILEAFSKDPKYFTNEVEFFELQFPDVAYVPCAIACFMVADNYFIEESLHLSLFEVSQPVRGNGRGTETMGKIIDVATENGYNYMTLMLRFPELKHFYGKFGFVQCNADEGGIPIMVKQLHF